MYATLILEEQSLRRFEHRVLLVRVAAFRINAHLRFRTRRTHEHPGVIVENDLHAVEREKLLHGLFVIANHDLGTRLRDIGNGVDLGLERGPHEGLVHFEARTRRVKATVFFVQGVEVFAEILAGCSHDFKSDEEAELGILFERVVEAGFSAMMFTKLEVATDLATQPCSLRQVAM